VKRADKDAVHRRAAFAIAAAKFAPEQSWMCGKRRGGTPCF